MRQDDGDAGRGHPAAEVLEHGPAGPREEGGGDPMTSMKAVPDIIRCNRRPFCPYDQNGGPAQDLLWIILRRRR
jgi:hypothetical protein